MAGFGEFEARHFIFYAKPGIAELFCCSIAIKEIKNEHEIIGMLMLIIKLLQKVCMKIHFRAFHRRILTDVFFLYQMIFQSYRIRMCEEIICSEARFEST